MIAPFVSTACAYSLAAYIEAAELSSATSVPSPPTHVLPRDDVLRSFADTPQSYMRFVPGPATTDITAVSEHTPIFIGGVGPEQEVIAQLTEFRSLEHGWDGENAEAPNRTAIREAVRFIRTAGPLAGRLEPTLHTDGSVLLEIEDGLEGVLRFSGDGQITYALRGSRPGTVGFDGSNIPPALKTALSLLTPIPERVA